MTVTSTTIPAAYDGFLNFLEASVPAGVEVVDGAPRAGQSSTQFVVLTGAETVGERKPRNMGPMFVLEETFELLGYIRCNEGSDLQSTSRASAFAIFSAIEAAVRTDPTLGTGGGNNHPRVSWFSKAVLQQGPADGARGNATVIEFALHVEALVQ